MYKILKEPIKRTLSWDNFLNMELWELKKLSNGVIIRKPKGLYKIGGS